MDYGFLPTTCRVGMVAAAAVALLGFSYAAVLVTGFLLLSAPNSRSAIRGLPSSNC